MEGGLRRVCGRSCGQGFTAAVDRLQLRFRLRLVASQSFRWRRSPTQFQFHVIREIFILISPQSEVAGAAITDACVHVCLSLSHSLASYLPSPSPALPLLSINIANNQSGLLLNMQIPGHMAGEWLGEGGERSLYSGWLHTLSAQLTIYSTSPPPPSPLIGTPRDTLSLDRPGLTHSA